MTTTADRHRAQDDHRRTGALIVRALGALGALVTHELAYLAIAALTVGQPSHSDHRHLSLQWAAVAPVALVAASLWVLRTLRSLGYRRASLSVPRLGANVVAFFVVQEVLEGLLTGHGPAQSLTHPATVAGVVLAPLVAWAIARLLGSAADVAARFVRLAAVVTAARPARPALVPVRHASRIASSPSRPRAPPTLLRS